MIGAKEDKAKEESVLTREVKIVREVIHRSRRRGM